MANILHVQKAGAPQGSIIRPLLFLLYINDLTKNLYSNQKLFADDTSLFSTVTNAAPLNFHLNENLSKTNAWANTYTNTNTKTNTMVAQMVQNSTFKFREIFIFSEFFIL